jgi:hypothetical protein
MPDEDDEALAKVVQQQMLEAGVLVRLHAEDGTVLLSSLAHTDKVRFETQEDIGTVHFLSVAINGEEIWRDVATGMPCNIPPGGSLLLDSVLELVRQAKYKKQLDDMRKKIDELKPEEIKMVLEDDDEDEPSGQPLHDPES